MRPNGREGADSVEVISRRRLMSIKENNIYYVRQLAELQMQDDWHLIIKSLIRHTWLRAHTSTSVVQTNSKVRITQPLKKIISVLFYLW